MRKLMKIFCYIGYYFFAYHLPENQWVGGKLWNAIRVFLARPLLRGCGKDIHIDRHVNFGKGDLLTLKDHSGIGAYSKLIGDITLERWAATSFDIFITAYGRKMDRTDIHILYQGKVPDEPVVLGEGTVLFASVIILPGVHTGEGCVIGAAAVVTRDVPPYSVVAGNPARVVKWRKPPGPEAFGPRMTPIDCEVPEESLPYYEEAQRKAAERRAAKKAAAQ
jgi:maltose O-acetyltransferase